MLHSAVHPVAGADPEPTLFQETLFAAMAIAMKDTTPHMTAAESPKAEDLLANR